MNPATSRRRSPIQAAPKKTPRYASRKGSDSYRLYSPTRERLGATEAIAASAAVAATASAGQRRLPKAPPQAERPSPKRTAPASTVRPVRGRMYASTDEETNSVGTRAA